MDVSNWRAYFNGVLPNLRTFVKPIPSSILEIFDPQSFSEPDFLLLQNFSVAISVSPHVCFILVLI